MWKYALFFVIRGQYWFIIKEDASSMTFFSVFIMYHNPANPKILQILIQTMRGSICEISVICGQMFFDVGTCIIILQILKSSNLVQNKVRERHAEARSIFKRFRSICEISVICGQYWFIIKEDASSMTFVSFFMMYHNPANSIILQILIQTMCGKTALFCVIFGKNPDSDNARKHLRLSA